MVLIYANLQNWGHPTFLRTPQALAMSQDERDDMSAGFEALMKEISESGELIGGAPLADPASATTVRVRDGGTVATDGPYVEAKEQFAGYFLLDCASPERAMEIAARFPDARFAAVEVRPVMGTSRADHAR
ncbi:YciI family protein [Sphaerisporangium corydalis]|uniref:YciI family protein n=1 Tax=Sphaerisporangium corydalis TaxID=1441875 RepID=A0ABV9ERW2_9ACTN|nr:YciI family protein [Sphaerisporangium corydalis]